ncbi:MAG: PEP-CTERM sorting domain-containing protein [Gammaproteobacteria bacterium]|nr:PEP-CTERM sorting domain-containing protein [Gammaproteobacteria bacterium]
MILGKKFSVIVAGLVLAFTTSIASAAVIDVDISGVASWDGEGSPLNTVLLLDLGGGGPVTIDGIGWDLTITSVGASWLSEAVIGFGGTANPNEVNLSAGAGDSFPGVGTYSSGGIVDFASIPLPNIELADGILRLEFFESFDDVTGDIDAFYEGLLSISGTGFATPTAEPGILMLFGLGLIGVVVARRKV